MLVLNSHNLTVGMISTGARPETELGLLDPRSGVRATGLSDSIGVYANTQITGEYTHAAVRTHVPVRAKAFWSNCPKFGKTSHFQRWKLPPE